MRIKYITGAQRLWRAIALGVKPEKMKDINAGKPFDVDEGIGSKLLKTGSFESAKTAPAEKKKAGGK